MVYLVYRDLMDRIRDGSLKQLTIAIRPEQSLAVGDEVRFEDIVSRKGGPDSAPAAEDESYRVSLTSAREAGEKRGYRLWQISWD